MANIYFTWLMDVLMSSMPPAPATSMVPRYQACSTLRGSSIGVGNVSLSPAAASPARAVAAVLGRASLPAPATDILWSTLRLKYSKF